VISIKRESQSNILISLIVISIITLHFSVTEIDGFPITFAVLFISLFFIKFYKLSFRIEGIFVLIIGLIIPIINLYTYNYMKMDIFSFMKTYSLWIVTLGAVTYCVYGKQKNMSIHSNFAKAIYISLLIIASYSILQVLLYKLFNIDLLFNPFRKYQYLYQNTTFKYSIRAQGFYLEPSFNALIVDSLLVMLLFLKYKIRNSIIITIISMTVIKSLAGIITLFIILFFYMLSVKRVKIKTFLIIFEVLISLILILNLNARLKELVTPGTSVYIRLILPIELVRESISENFTGIAFGQMENIVKEYGYMNDFTMNKGIDNGLYFLIVYFGIWAISLSAFLLARGFFSNNKKYQLLILYLFLIIQFSGGVFAPEFIYIICLVIYSYRISNGPLIYIN